MNNNTQVLYCRSDISLDLYDVVFLFLIYTSNFDNYWRMVYVYFSQMEYVKELVGLDSFDFQVANSMKQVCFANTSIASLLLSSVIVVVVIAC